MVDFYAFFCVRVTEKPWFWLRLTSSGKQQVIASTVAIEMGFAGIATRHCNGYTNS